MKLYSYRLNKDYRDKYGGWEWNNSNKHESPINPLACFRSCLQWAWKQVCWWFYKMFKVLSANFSAKSMQHKTTHPCSYVHYLLNSLVCNYTQNLQVSLSTWNCHHNLSTLDQHIHLCLKWQLNIFISINNHYILYFFYSLFHTSSDS